jgi:Glucodextranase, domain B
MTSRRGTAHVRPRPPSSGRPRQPVKVKAPDRRRVRVHRGLEDRRPRAPLATRTLLALSVVLLAGAALLAAGGGIGPAVSALNAGFGQAIGRLTATPIPSTIDLPPTDAPRIATPEEPYTGQETVDLQVTLPTEVVGEANAKVRIYLALEGLQAVPVLDQAVGTTIRMVIPLQLEPGRNDVSATLFRGNVESDHSPIVSWFLDREPPSLTITSPEDGASIDRSEATIRGTTQGGTTIVARNLTNGASITTVSAQDGAFELALLLAPGANDIELSGTDPAGNVGTATLRIAQGSTEMRVQLRASSYNISVKRHPSSLQLVVLVTAPGGEPLAGARAFFTLQIPGLAPISNELTTAVDGRAIFTTPLVGELDTGGGVGTVLVSHDDYGERTDRVTLRFVK